MEDKLRWFSKTMSFSRSASDNMMLSLKYGKSAIKNDIFYGSDFFLETQKDLYDMIKNSPNGIETSNLLIRLTQRRNMFNKGKAKRETLLYKLIPYSNNVDFDKALEKDMVDQVTMEFQTRFTYWISMFESFFGNIAVFWDGMKTSDSEKLVTINNLIVSLINKNKNQITNQDGKETSNQP